MRSACLHAERVASDSASGNILARPAGEPAEAFTRLLDAIVAQLAPESLASLDVPSDELHQEILIPLLPAMLSDKAIRNHWREQKGNSFFSRLQSHMSGDAPRPSFSANDFEIHVTASYSAGADARALADTLLSEESLRDLAANLVNNLLDAAWAQLPVEEKVVPEEVGITASVTPEPVGGALPEEVPAAVVEPIPEPEELPETAATPNGFEDVAAATMPAPAPVGVVLRAAPFRPQPWRTQHNPVAGNHAEPKFPDPLARNPLEQRSKPRHVFRAFKMP